MSNKREERQRRVVSAKKRIMEHESGTGTKGTLKLPDGISFFKVKTAGAKRVDIIPYVVGKGNPFSDEGELHYERTYWSHRGIGANNESFLCLQKTFKKKCFICEYRAKLSVNDDMDEKEKEKMVKDLAPKERQLFNVIDNDEKDKGIQVWDVSYHLFGKALDEHIKGADEDEGLDFFADLEKGKTIKINAADKSMGSVKFLSYESMSFKNRSEPLPDSLIDEATCLDNVLVEVTYDQQKKAFMQFEEPEEETKKETKSSVMIEDEDEDEEPVVKPSKKVVKKPEPEPEENEEEEEVKPTPNKKKVEEKKEIKTDDYVYYKGEEHRVSRILEGGKKFNLETLEGRLVKGIALEDISTDQSEDDDEE